MPRHLIGSDRQHSRSTATTYRPEIDGLRAIAVGVVVLYHAGITGFSGGFIGVDVFFVISGFLITSILAAELERGRFSLLRFYDRRARRILPALFVVIACTIPFALAWMVPWQFQEFVQSVLAALGFVSNLFFWQVSGYFDVEAAEKPLLHTWSLAVEEQYYLLFPPVLALLWRGGRRTVLTVLTLTALGSLALAEWGWRHYPTASFFLTPTRVWEILLGAIAALLPIPKGRWRELPALAGLAAVLAAVPMFDHGVPVPSLYLLGPLAGVAAMLLCAQHGTLSARVLSLPPLVGLGLVSYSLYLWHQPVLALARLRFAAPDAPLVTASLLLLSLALAILSYRWVEQPFRRRRANGGYRLPAPRMAGLLGGGAVALAGLAVFGWAQIAQGRYLFQPIPTGAAFVNYREEWSASVNLFTRGPQATKIATSFSDTGPDRFRVLVTGDSNAGTLFNALEQNRAAFPAYEFRVAPYFDGCMVQRPPRTADWTRECLADHARKHAALVSEATHVLMSMKWTKLSTAELDEMIGAAVAYYRDLGKTVVVTSTTEIFRPNAPFLVNALYRQGLLEKDKADELFYQHRSPDVAEYDRIVAAAADRAGALFLRKSDFICDEPTRRCAALTDAGAAIYYDDHHYTVAGAAYLGARIAATGWLDPVAAKR